MRETASSRMVLLLSAASAVAVDQVTKLAIYQRLNGSLEIIPGILTFRGDSNPGVVWGLLRQWPSAVLVINVIAITLVLFFLRRGALGKMQSFAWGLVVGGAIGNLVDRLHVGHVKDFIVVRANGWAWPTFNVADSCITVGACIVVWHLMFIRRPQP